MTFAWTWFVTPGKPLERLKSRIAFFRSAKAKASLSGQLTAEDQTRECPNLPSWKKKPKLQASRASRKSRLRMRKRQIASCLRRRKSMTRAEKLIFSRCQESDHYMELELPEQCMASCPEIQMRKKQVLRFSVNSHYGIKTFGISYWLLTVWVLAIVG